MSKEPLKLNKFIDINVYNQDYTYYYTEGTKGFKTVVLDEDDTELFVYPNQASEFEVRWLISLYVKAYRLGKDFGTFSTKRDIQEAIGLRECNNLFIPT